jgi:hypothetical protein
MERTFNSHEATAPRMVKVVQHHAYRSRPQREYFYIRSLRDVGGSEQMRAA